MPATRKRATPALADCVTIKEAARIARCCPNTVRNWRNKHAFQSFIYLHRVYLPRAELDALIEHLKTP